MIYWDEIWGDDDDWEITRKQPEKELDAWETNAMRRYARDWLEGDTSRLESDDLPPVRHSVVLAEIKREREGYAAYKAKKELSHES
jgi:hypothetical protein